MAKSKEPVSFQYTRSDKAKALGLEIKQPRFGDSGYDLQACDSLSIFKGEQMLVPTGLIVEIPMGYVGLVKERSSLALRSLYVHAGVIDPGYRGEIQVLIENRGDSNYHIDAGQRIAQLLFLPCRANMVAKEVVFDELSKTPRGDGNFGSTGK